MLGAVMFVFLFILRAQQGGFGWPLAVQSGLAAVLLVFARNPDSRAPLRERLLAWLSAFLPMGMEVGRIQAWAGLPGLTLTIWAMLALGRSFDVAPASRSLVMSGPYSLVRHPMYAGELLSLIGILLLAPTAQNFGIFVLFVLALLMRIRAEEKVVAGYEQYAVLVPWRLLPYVW